MNIEILVTHSINVWLVFHVNPFCEEMKLPSTAWTFLALHNAPLLVLGQCVRLEPDASETPGHAAWQKKIMLDTHNTNHSPWQVAG